MQIRLDTAALSALFPEGSEARVELQSAVMAEFVRKNIKPGAMGTDFQAVLVGEARNLADQIKRGIADAKHSVFKEIGVAMPRSEWDQVQLNQQQLQAIRNAAREAVSNALTEVINERIQFHATKLEGTISHNIEAALNRLTNEELNRRFAERLAQLTAGS